MLFRSMAQFILKENGYVMSWGAGGSNGTGLLGHGNTSNLDTPTTISGLSDIIQVSDNDNQHVLFLKNDGTVYSSGLNGNGQLGHGDTTNRSSATLISGLSDVIQVSAGAGTSLFLLKDGTVKSCGKNDNNQISPGSTSDITTPAAISGLSNVVKVLAGKNCSFFIINDGTVKVLGSSGGGVFGDNLTGTKTTLYTLSLTNVIDISTSLNTTFSAVVLSDGTVKTTGNNSRGQLGQGNTTNLTSWTAVSGLSDIIKVWCFGHSGTECSFFLKSNGTVFACGDNGLGQLGVGDTTDRTSPTTTGYTNIASFGHDHIGKRSFGVDKDGNFRYAGQNTSGSEFGTGNDETTTITSTVTTQTTTTYVADTWSVTSGGQRLQGNNNIFKHLESSTALAATSYPAKFRFISNSTTGTYAINNKKVETMKSQGTFYAYSDTAAPSTSSGGDPYVKTIYGELYKLDNISGYCRMLQGKIDNKNFVLNVEMKMDNEEEEEEMNAWSSYWDDKNIIKNNDDSHEQTNQSFFTKVYIKYGESELLFDIPNFKVLKQENNGIELNYLDKTNYSTLPMYTNDGTEDTLYVKCGEVVIMILRSSNKQIRSEVSIGGHAHIKEPYGFIVTPMNTKICSIKKLNTTKFLEKKKTPNYKRETHNYFYTINKDTKQCEKNLQTIKCF